MIVVGLTGSLSSGKTEAGRLLKKSGAQVFDADVAARQAVQKGMPVYRAIVKIFGKDYLLPGGQLDRKKLAERVFSHPKDLKTLNILIHPMVISECLKRIQALKSKQGILVLDVPLLFESKMERLADTTVLISAPLSKIIERSRKKGISPALAKKILSTQWTLAKKKRLADFVVENNGTTAQLEAKIKVVVKEIKEQFRD